MDEQTKTQEQTEQNENQHYIDAIAELKANTVSKDKYNKVVEENKNLIKTLIDGGQIETSQVAPPQKSLEELRKELFTPKRELSNLEYVTKALELRERVLEETGEDCFVSNGHKAPTQDEYITAQKVADIYKECIEYADGDNERFTAELNRRIVDNPVARNRR